MVAKSEYQPHWLKPLLKNVELPYWQIRKAVGLSEFKICRILQGVDEVPDGFETKVQALISQKIIDGKIRKHVVKRRKP